MEKVHWKPHPRQEYALLKAQEYFDEILYGGARGGGKTDTGQVWLIEPKYLKEPKYRALVIRRNSDDLKDWTDRAQEMYLPLDAVTTGNPPEIVFPSGAKIRTGHLKDDKAYTKYQGHEYQKMLIEELTQISQEKHYEKLIGSCRSTIPGLKAQVFATTNPDGDGHYWVKKRFKCEQVQNGCSISESNIGSVTKRRIFIPARIEDNPTLVENDPNYVAYLDSIQDETLKKQWREGSWSDPKIEGAYYAEYLEKAEKQGRITKVKYEEGIPVDTWWDLGVSDYTAIWFTQMIGNEIRVIDYEESEGEGIPYYYNLLQGKGYNYGTHYWPHDGEVRELSTGKSRKQTAESLGLRPINIVPRLGGPAEITEGINQARGVMQLCWFDIDNCADGINCLRNHKKEFDEKRDVYKDRPVHNWASHGADAFRTLGVGYNMFKRSAGTLFNSTGNKPKFK